MTKYLCYTEKLLIYRVYSTFILLHYVFLCGSNIFCVDFQIFPGIILSDIKPAKRMKFKTVCYLLVQLMHCRKMFKAEIPFSNVMTCEDDDKVCDTCNRRKESVLL